MAFWGIETKPGNPVTLACGERSRLRITQATLGIGSATKKCILQCNLGNKSPVLLCALLPEKTESCHLDLEFEETEDVVFSVIGPRSVYLTGYFVGNNRHSLGNSDTESFGEDIGETESEENKYCSEEDTYEDSFINDGDPNISSPSLSTGEAGKDVADKDKPREKKGGRKRLKKRYQMVNSDDSNSLWENAAADSSGLKYGKDGTQKLEKKNPVVKSDEDSHKDNDEYNITDKGKPKDRTGGHKQPKKKSHSNVSDTDSVSDDEQEDKYLLSVFRTRKAALISSKSEDKAEKKMSKGTDSEEAGRHVVQIEGEDCTWPRDAQPEKGTKPKKKSKKLPKEMMNSEENVLIGYFKAEEIKADLQASQDVVSGNNEKQALGCELDSRTTLKLDKKRKEQYKDVKSHAALAGKDSNIAKQRKEQEALDRSDYENEDNLKQNPGVTTNYVELHGGDFLLRISEMRTETSANPKKRKKDGKTKQKSAKGTKGCSEDIVFQGQLKQDALEVDKLSNDCCAANNHQKQKNDLFIDKVDLVTVECPSDKKSKRKKKNRTLEEENAS